MAKKIDSYYKVKVTVKNTRGGTYDSIANRTLNLTFVNYGVAWDFARKALARDDVEQVAGPDNAYALTRTVKQALSQLDFFSH